MPALYVTEAQRYWLERFAEERRIEWLLRACRREDPARRTLPATKWRGSDRVR
jgi:hypothetical protein